MNIVIIGSGAREHSICASLNRSKKKTKIFCLPGNAGTEKIAKNIYINLNNFKKIKNFILKNKIELVIVGPEKPLVSGIVDFLESLILKFLDQILKLLNLMDQKYLIKRFVKNIIYLLLGLESLKINLKQ